MRYFASMYGYGIDDPLVAYEADQLCDDYGEYLTH